MLEVKKDSGAALSTKKEISEKSHGSATAPDSIFPEEGEQQCFWTGTVGRCVLKFGHFPATPHKEDHGPKSY
jgi:hypothetical protein